MKSLEGKLAHRSQVAENSLAKDLRKRSLNFHYFTKQASTDMEVAVRVTRRIRSLKSISGLGLRELVETLMQGSSGDIDSSSAQSLLRLAGARFDELPAEVYSELANLTLKVGPCDSAPQKITERIVAKVLKFPHVREVLSSNSGNLKVLGMCAMSRGGACSTASKRAFLDFIGDGLLRLHRFDGDSQTLTHDMLVYLETLPRRSKNRLRLLRTVKTRLTAHLSMSPPADRPSFTLFKSTTVADPTKIIELVCKYYSILGTGEGNSPLWSFSRFRRALNAFLLSHKHSVPMEIIRSEVRLRLPSSPLTRSTVLSFMRRSKNLKALSSADLTLLADGVKTGALRDRFQIKRLQRAAESRSIEIKVSKNSIASFPKPHGRWKGSRPYRRRLHSWIKMNDPLRIQKDQLCDVPLNLWCGNIACKVCARFEEKISIARLFHFPY